MSISDPDLAARFERYCAQKLKRPLQVTALSRIYGGASRETYRLRVTENGLSRGLILRRDPVSALIETEREVEFAAYRAFHNSAVPVPEAVALEADTSWLDRSFFVMEEIENAAAGSILQPEAYAPHKEKLGAQFWSALGAIAGADPATKSLNWLAPAPADAWRVALDHWVRVIDEDEREPQPIARAAIRWLRRAPPPPAQKIAIVHGDFRSGNFLFDSEGKLRAVLDWEMAHLGDPLEDLAWALDPLWAHGDPQRPAGLIPRPQAIELWERSSGLRADPSALRWWEMFASLKGLAIWISAAREVTDGRNTDPVNVFSGWYCLAFHNALIAERLAAETAL